MKRRNRPSHFHPLTNLLSHAVDLRLPMWHSTHHLQIELTLWFCTVLLTAASSLVLYKHSYLSTSGDAKVLLCVGLWTGRHFLVRLLCSATWVDVPRPRGTAGGWRRRRS